LFLDVGVGHLSSALFAFARLGPILFCRARHCRRPFVRSMTNTTGEEWFHQTCGGEIEDPRGLHLWSPGGLGAGLSLVLREAHDEALAVPKLHNLAIGGLGGLADRLLFVGALDHVRRP
jgi:hypothetical protein